MFNINGINGKKKQQQCSFCGKTLDQVQKLHDGQSAHICDTCIKKYHQNMAEGDQLTPRGPYLVTNFSPKEINNALSQHVIGQEEAKKSLSVAVYNHYKRINAAVSDDINIKKSNILLIGPTGSGKTLLVQTLSRLLNVPMVTADATSLTEAGCAGEDVENILLNLLRQADYNPQEAEKGIIYIDEVDKIARKASNLSSARDISGEGVQQALLKMLEGTIVNVPVNGEQKQRVTKVAVDSQQQDYIQLDTSNILFICGGAFVGLDKIISRRISTNNKGIGFTNEIQGPIDYGLGEVLQNALPSDLIEFGLIPEFVGRLPVISTLEPLDREMLIRILTEPKNALVKQYKKLFELDNIKLEFDDAALDAVAEEAVQRGVGARGLESIMERTLRDIMYEVPSQHDIYKCIITKDVVLQKADPIFVTAEKWKAKEKMRERVTA